jgi:hypothetical protein
MHGIAEAVRRDGVDPDGGAARLERAEPVRRGRGIHSRDPLLPLSWQEISYIASPSPQLQRAELERARAAGQQG